LHRAPALCSSDHYIPIEYRPLVKAAKETGGAFREAYVAQAAIDVERVEVVLESRAHRNIRFKAHGARYTEKNTSHRPTQTRTMFHAKAQRILARIPSPE
jgi:hypothetical protein